MWHIESSQQLSDLVCDVNAKNYVEAATASTLIKEFVGKLVQIKGYLINNYYNWDTVYQVFFSN